MANHKITNREIKRKNRNRIYRYLCKSGIVSNPDIAYALKLSLPTVTQNTKELLEMGLIKENGELESTGGRKAKALSAIPDARLAVGIDITEHHVGFLLTDLIGEVLRYERIQALFQETPQYFQEVNQKLEEFLEKDGTDRERILGLGISVPGIVDLEKREITNSHALHLKGFSLEKMEKYFSYPCIFLNDANAGAYGEGIGREEEKRFFYLSLSNTVGGAYFNERKLVYGSEFRCGEVGHMTLVLDGLPCYCGKRGCLDAYCNAGRLAEFAGGKLEDFFKGLEQGKETFVREWKEYIRYLALAVNNIHMVLDCDIILGGYTGNYLADHLQEIRDKVSQYNTFSENGGFVRECKYKVGAAAFGAARYVTEVFTEQI